VARGIYEVAVEQLQIAHNLAKCDRTKNIEIDQHLIKGKLGRGLIYTVYVPLRKQLADVLSKGLPTNWFQDLIGKQRTIHIHHAFPLFPFT